MVATKSQEQERKVGASRTSGTGAGQWLSVRTVIEKVETDLPGAELPSQDVEVAVQFVKSLITSRARDTSRWAELLGPVATPKVVTELLGMSRQGLDKARERGDVLGVRSAGGRWVYPLRQFRADRGQVRTLDRFGDVLKALLTTGDGAASARWLATPNRRLDASTPWEVLAAGEGTEKVLDAAHAQARAWGGR